MRDVVARLEKLIAWSREIVPRSRARDAMLRPKRITPAASPARMRRSSAAGGVAPA